MSAEPGGAFPRLTRAVLTAGTSEFATGVRISGAWAPTTFELPSPRPDTVSVLLAGCWGEGVVEDISTAPLEAPTCSASTGELSCTRAEGADRTHVCADFDTGNVCCEETSESFSPELASGHAVYASSVVLEREEDLGGITVRVWRATPDFGYRIDNLRL